MFNILIEGNFEYHEEEINSLPPIQTWKELPKGIIQTVTDIRQSVSGFWISCKGVGAIEINCQTKTIQAYPVKDISLEQFEYFVIHAWLPLAYQACGMQVIHASAVVHGETQQLILLCGASGSGKSTLAFGLAKRKNWNQVADDRVAFEVFDGNVEPRYIPDMIKLRQPSAEHFKHEALSFENIDWFTSEMKLGTIFILEQLPSSRQDELPSFNIEPLNKIDAFARLLKQAITLTPGLRELNQDLIRDYLVLANQVKTYTLNYTPRFDALSDLIHSIEERIE